MSYQLKSIKKTMGREGQGFTATLHLNGKKIADVADYGDGGSLHFDYVNRQVQAEQEVALAVWHRENCLGDYSKALESDDEQAVNLLYSFQENDKKSRNAIIFEVGVDYSTLNDEEAKEYFYSGRQFSEHEEYILKNTTIQDANALARIARQYPTARVWDSSSHRYKAVNELVSA